MATYRDRDGVMQNSGGGAMQNPGGALTGGGAAVGAMIGMNKQRGVEGANFKQGVNSRWGVSRARKIVERDARLRGGTGSLWDKMMKPSPQRVNQGIGVIRAARDAQMKVQVPGVVGRSAVASVKGGVLGAGVGLAGAYGIKKYKESQMSAISNVTEFRANVGRVLRRNAKTKAANRDTAKKKVERAIVATKTGGKNFWEALTPLERGQLKFGGAAMAVGGLGIAANRAFNPNKPWRKPTGYDPPWRKKPAGYNLMARIDDLVEFAFAEKPSHKKMRHQVAATDIGSIGAGIATGYGIKKFGGEAMLAKSRESGGLARAANESAALTAEKARLKKAHRSNVGVATRSGKEARRLSGTSEGIAHHKRNQKALDKMASGRAKFDKVDAKLKKTSGRAPRLERIIGAKAGRLATTGLIGTVASGLVLGRLYQGNKIRKERKERQKHLSARHNLTEFGLDDRLYMSDKQKAGRKTADALKAALSAEKKAAFDKIRPWTPPSLSWDLPPRVHEIQKEVAIHDAKRRWLRGVGAAGVVGVLGTAYGAGRHLKKRREREAKERQKHLSARHNLTEFNATVPPYRMPKWMRVAQVAGPVLGVGYAAGSGYGAYKLVQHLKKKRREREAQEQAKKKHLASRHDGLTEFGQLELSKLREEEADLRRRMKGARSRYRKAVGTHIAGVGIIGAGVLGAHWGAQRLKKRREREAQEQAKKKHLAARHDLTEFGIRSDAWHALKASARRRHLEGKLRAGMAAAGPAAKGYFRGFTSAPATLGESAVLGGAAGVGVLGAGALVSRSARKRREQRRERREQHVTGFAAHQRLDLEIDQLAAKNNPTEFKIGKVVNKVVHDAVNATAKGAKTARNSIRRARKGAAGAMKPPKALASYWGRLSGKTEKEALQRFKGSVRDREAAKKTLKRKEAEAGDYLKRVPKDGKPGTLAQMARSDAKAAAAASTRRAGEAKYAKEAASKAVNQGRSTRRKTVAAAAGTGVVGTGVLAHQKLKKKHLAARRGGNLIEFSTRAMREAAKGALSSGALSRLKGTWGSERLVKRIGSGGTQNADLVLHPSYGVSVRKSAKSGISNPNFVSKPAARLMKTQQRLGTTGGFAKVHEVGPKGLSYHEYVPGKTLAEGKLKTGKFLRDQVNKPTPGKKDRAARKKEAIRTKLEGWSGTPSAKYLREQRARKAEERVFQREMPRSRDQKRMIRELKKDGAEWVNDLTRRNIIKGKAVDYEIGKSGDDWLSMGSNEKYPAHRVFRKRKSNPDLFKPKPEPRTTGPRTPKK